MSAALRTIADVEAAGARLGASMPPLTQAQADNVAVLLHPWLPMPAERLEELTVAAARRVLASNRDEHAA